MKLARTISTFFEDGFRAIKTKYGKSNVETSKSSNPFGFDANPPKGLIAVLAETMSNEDPIVIGYLNASALDSLGIGDSIVYSTDSNGANKATITLRNDGTIEMLGTGDFMVRFSELETAYNQLKDDHDGLVSAFNQHVHPTAAVGSPSPPTAIPSVIPATPSTGDISGAKIEEIKTSS